MINFGEVGLDRGQIQDHANDTHPPDQDHILLDHLQDHQVQAQGHLGQAQGQGQDRGSYYIFVSNCVRALFKVSFSLFIFLIVITLR